MAVICGLIFYWRRHLLKQTNKNEIKKSGDEDDYLYADGRSLRYRDLPLPSESNNESIGGEYYEIVGHNIIDSVASDVNNEQSINISVDKTIKQEPQYTQIFF